MTLDSHGTVCAALNGISKDVVDRATDIIRLAARGEDLVSACVQLSEGEVEELNAAEEAARRFVMEFNIEEDGEDGDGEGRESARARLTRVMQGVSGDD